MLKAARGKVLITPSRGFPMAGNIRMDNKSRGVHDDLFCNILILDDNCTKICLLGFDLIGLEFNTCEEIRNLISDSTGIPSQNIVIWATHTHSGPDTGMRLYSGSEKAVKSFLDDLVCRVSDGVIRANTNFENVRIKAGRATVTGLSFNRRLVREDGNVVMNFENFRPDEITGTTGPVDDELITLSVWDMEDNLFALMVNFALHPAILVGYKWLISRDFINYLDKHVSDFYGNDVVTLFANGAEGNINHLNYQSNNQLRNFREAERVGRRLGKFVNESIENSKFLEGKIRLVYERSSIPFRMITSQEIEWAGMVIERDKDLSEDMFDGIPDKTYARMILEMKERKNTECDILIQGMALNDFAFVTFPGEVFVEYGLKVKEISPYRHTMIIGLANGQAGYIPSKEAFNQGGYEVKTAWTSQLVQEAGEILVDIVANKILNPLFCKSVRTLERKSSENKYLHKDFHIALNMMLKYIHTNYGGKAFTDYLKQYSHEFYKPLKDKLLNNDFDALYEYFIDIYKKEEWPVTIIKKGNCLEIEQISCPAISWIRKKGHEPCKSYRETYNTVFTTLCQNTPVDYSLDYFDDVTGACKQRFILKDSKT